MAQEFALQYSSRVRSLILGCTAAGGPNAVQAEPEALQTLMRRGLTPEESKEAITRSSMTLPLRANVSTKISLSAWNGFPSRRDMQANFKEFLDGKPTAASRR